MGSRGFEGPTRPRGFDGSIRPRVRIGWVGPGGSRRVGRTELNGWGRADGGNHPSGWIESGGKKEAAFGGPHKIRRVASFAYDLPSAFLLEIWRGVSMGFFRLSKQPDFWQIDSEEPFFRMLDRRASMGTLGRKGLVDSMDR